MSHAPPYLDYNRRVNAAEQTCRRCGHDRAWLLRPVRETHGHVMVVEIVPVPSDAKVAEYALGTYEALVCAQCGHTILWARDYRPERAAAPTDDACPDCGDALGWTIAEAPDADEFRAARMRVKLAPNRLKPSLLLSRGGWNASLSVRICRSCARSRWKCRPDPASPDDVADGVTSARPCGDCGSDQWRVELHDQQFQATFNRAIALDRVFGFERARGRFVADICRRCLSVDWFGESLAELKPSPASGVTLIARADRAPGKQHGPYR
jgi:hypothetical protein